MSPGTEVKKRIAVLGGGLGSLSTVVALTDQPGWQDRYEITVYQMGWRLGGKGASGRNADAGQRIEEHGLHVWMGCYHNAFDMIQRCYDECREHNLTPGSPFQTWRDAFMPNSLVTVIDRFQDQWLPWTTVLPTNSLIPGTGGLWLSPWDYVKELLDFMVRRVEQAGHAVVREFVRAHAVHTVTTWVREVIAGCERIVEGVVEAVEHPVTFLHRARDLAEAMHPDPSNHTAGQQSAIIDLVDRFLAGLRDSIETELGSSVDLHRLWILLNLGGAMVKGMIRDNVIYEGFDVIDGHEYQAWLRRNGATPEVAWSAPVRAIYDLVFAYEQGDDRRPNIAAGVALQICLRVAFGYRGAPVYRMKAGMGDTIFTPIYKVLRNRGVKFRFFHRVDQLRLSPTKQYIEEIDLGIQATLTEDAKKRNPDGEYTPLTPPIHGLECWPSDPLYAQLEQGEKIEKGGYDLESPWTDWPDVSKLSLRRGVDFDAVVLGISIAALPDITGALAEANPSWKAMLDGVRTVATQACQVWGNHDSQAMGWAPPADDGPVQPNIWAAYPWSGADMSHLIAMEDWPAADDVRNISYYCRQLEETGPIPPPGPNPAYPASQDERVRQNAISFLGSEIAPIWPKAVAPDDPNAINWDWVVAPGIPPGPERFGAQYWTASVEPTERYVMSVAGSTRYRLTSENCGFLNLYITGDWTINGFNAGCVEAAVTSGLMACRALTGSPQVIVGAPDAPR